MTSRSFRRPGTSFAALAATLLFSHSASHSADVEWVGYQNGCGGDSNPDVGSFFHGDNWLGYLSPGPGDRALFGTQFDEPPTGYPNTIHFGDFCFEAGICEPVLIPGGVAELGDLEFRDDTWILDFTVGSSGCPVDPAPPGSLLLTAAWTVGHPATGPATVDVLNGYIDVALLNVGRDGGTGNLHLQGGSQTYVGAGLLVGFAGGNGSVTVSGAGTLLEKAECCDAGIGFGSGSNGTLQVLGGAAFHLGSGNHFVGREGGTGHFEMSGGATSQVAGTFHFGGDGVGTGSVDGNGTSWTIDLLLTLGLGETGELEITGGAEVSAGAVAMSVSEGASGSLLVSGTGSALTSGGDIKVAERGSATLTVDDGGSIESSNFVLFGQLPGATGTGQILDAGSSVSAFFIEVGSQGTGTLDVLAGGLATATYFGVGTLGGTGEVRVEGSGAMVHADNFVGVGDLGGLGTLIVGPGGTVSSPGWVALGVGGTGILALEGGTVDAEVRIWDGGCLQGEGTILGDIVNRGGKLSPGDAMDPHGIIDVDGDLDFTPETGPTELDLAGPQPGDDHDKVRATGNAAFNGNLVIRLADGYVPAEGDTFSIIEYGSTFARRGGEGDFDCFTGLDIGDILSLEPRIDPTAYRLIVSPASGNQAPLAVADSSSTPADEEIVLDLVANDSDPDFDGLRIFDLDLTSTSGHVTIDTDSTVLYVPDTEFTGIDTFVYGVTDCVGGAAFATVYVEVTSPTLNFPEDENESPVAFDLDGVTVSPNPFRDDAEIRWSVPTPSDVEIAIYDVLGRRVRTLVKERLALGSHVATWNGRNDSGSSLPAGAYFVRRSSAEGEAIRRFVLVR
jgi:T5SS/PEP-CTERM-associated repeat protein